MGPKGQNRDLMFELSTRTVGQVVASSSPVGEELEDSEEFSYIHFRLRRFYRIHRQGQDQDCRGRKVGEGEEEVENDYGKVDVPREWWEGCAVRTRVGVPEP